MPRKIKIDERKELTTQAAYDDFIRYQKVKNSSEYTIAHYKNIVAKFSKFYNLNAPVYDITQNTVAGYILFLQAEKLAERTIHTYIIGLRTFLYFCMRSEYLEEFKVIAPKYEKTAKAVYTDRELKKLIVKPKRGSKFTDYRDWALVSFLVGTGMRLNTVINIKIGDIDLYEGIVLLRITKAKRQTVLPLSSSVIDILKQYLKFRRGSENDYVFCNATGGQLTRSGIGDAVKYYNLNRGVKTTSIHAFRHTFAKKYLMSGGDIFRLQRLMCHADLQSTKQYLEMNLTDLQMNYDKFNPLSQLK